MPLRRHKASTGFRRSLLAGSATGFKRRGGANPYTRYALAFDPKNTQYWANGVQYAGASALPGYSYTRSGSKAEPTTTGVSAPFAPNVPAITDKGYYSEAGFTNLLLWSEDLTNAAHTRSDVTGDASTLTPNATNTVHYASQATGTATVGHTYTHWRDVKADGYSYCSVTIAASRCWAAFDLSNGTVVGSSVDGVNFSNPVPFIIPLGNGVYRCGITATALTTITLNAQIAIHPTLTNTYTSVYAGDGVSGIKCYRGQVFDGTNPYPYAPTTTAAASVGADDLELAAALPNGDFIAWAVVDLPDQITRGLFHYSTAGAGASSDVLFVGVASGANLTFSVTAGGASQPTPADLVGGLAVGRNIVLIRRRNGVYSMAAKPAGGSVQISPDAATAGAVPTVTAADVGNNRNGTNPMGGIIEFFGQKNGTFSDADITALLQAA